MKNHQVEKLKVAVIGFGSQGHAHALNLKESGYPCVVGLYEGSESWARAEAYGFEVMTVKEAVLCSDLIAVLIPDEKQPQVFNESIMPYLSPNKCLLFAHGFGIHFKYIDVPSDMDVVLVAPKGPGHIVRRMYEQGMGVPALMAVHQDATGSALNKARQYAEGIGATRAGLIQTTFKEETETDLFGEQAVLCGGLTALVQSGFETLVEAGYQKEIAYFECLHELKLIVDLMYEGGFEKMRHSISNTAEFGDYYGGSQIVNGDVKGRMQDLLKRIQSGEFAKRWMDEVSMGMPLMVAKREEMKGHDLTRVGQQIRSQFAWV